MKKAEEEEGDGKKMQLRYMQKSAGYRLHVCDTCT
jgi:hypothetical protein